MNVADFHLRLGDTHFQQKLPAKHGIDIPVLARHFVDLLSHM